MNNYYESNVQETSKKAYKELKDLGERQKQVYNAIKTLQYCTNTMIAKVLKLPINSITPRTKELREMSFVIESHKSWCPITKRKAIYWKINKKRLFNNP